MFCRKCGSENKEEAVFCKRCGASLAASPKTTKAKKRIWIFLSALIVSALAMAGVVIAKDKQVKRQYQGHIAKAEKYLEELDYENAEDEYLKAIKIAPKEEQAYISLEELYKTLEKPEEAKKIRKQKKERAKPQTKSSKKDSPQSQKDKSESDKKDMSVSDKPKYKWVVKPVVEADDIYYVKSSNNAYCINDLNRQLESKYAVIQKGKSLGLIDMNGNMNGGFDYKEISSFVNGEILLTRTTPKYEESFQNEKELYYLNGDNIEPIQGIGGGDRIQYFYYDKELLVYTDASSQGEVTPPSNPIPVQHIKKVTDNVNGNWWEQAAGKYAVYADGGLITDYIYEECGSYSDGLIAVKKDGKWGYIDEKGKEVIPIQYDASWKQFDSTAGNGDISFKDYCYAASDGYVVICKGSRWELRDTDGNVIVPAGKFQKICPVYRGKCWVKENEKWGVIQLEGEEKEDNDAEDLQTHQPGSENGEEMAARLAKEKYGDDFSYFCTGDFSYQGKEYYVVDVKKYVEGHLTRMTQVFVSKDGTYVGEGYYNNNGSSEQIEFY